MKTLLIKLTEGKDTNYIQISTIHITRTSDTTSKVSAFSNMTNSIVDITDSIKTNYANKLVDKLAEELAKESKEIIVVGDYLPNNKTELFIKKHVDAGL